MFRRALALVWFARGAGDSGSRRACGLALREGVNEGSMAAKRCADAPKRGVRARVNS